MISISMTVADADGNIVIMNTYQSDFGKKSARVSRVATLDGGAVIVHSGASHGDRTFALNCRVTEAQAVIITYIYENSTSILVSIADGLFYGVISELEIKHGKLKATILIESKESN